MFIFLLPILFAILYIIYKNIRKPKKHIFFVGPRSTGKTSTLYYLLNKKEVETVPSLEDFEVTYKNYIIHDVIEKKGKTFNDIYSIKTDDKYFFFFRNNDQLIDYEKGYDVTFVFTGKSKKCDLRNEMRHKLVCLEDEPERMRKLIEKV